MQHLGISDSSEASERTVGEGSQDELSPLWNQQVSLFATQWFMTFGLDCLPFAAHPTGENRPPRRATAALPTPGPFGEPRLSVGRALPAVG